jgi:hypothetical protein
LHRSILYANDGCQCLSDGCLSHAREIIEGLSEMSRTCTGRIATINGRRVAVA